MPDLPPNAQTEILILGGGLAGAAAATILARAGRHVTLVEREREPRHKVCGEFLSAEALTLLAHLGLPLHTPLTPSFQPDFPHTPSSRLEPEGRSGETPVFANARAETGVPGELARRGADTGVPGELARRGADTGVPGELARRGGEGTSQTTPQARPQSFTQSPQAVPIHTVRLASHSHLTQAPLPFPAASLTRRCLDTLLLTAAEQSGAHLLRGATAQSLLFEDNRWQAHLNTGETLTAPQAILATGKHDLRGFPRPAGVQGDLVAMKMYWRLAPEQHAALGNAVELLLHPHGYTGLQPVENGIANLCGVVRRRHLTRLGGWKGLLAELRQTNPHAAQRLAGATPLLDKPLAIASIPYGFVRRDAIAGHLWAVGDQAAVIPSFTGDGMSIALFTGIAAAQSILANELSATFQRRLHAQLRWQVARATALSRALVHGPSKNLLVMAATLWPGALRRAASFTRLPKHAISALEPAF